MSSTRLLKNARLINKPTAENDQYTFSSSYCLSIYPINAAYTFIPKNACSSLRFSVAVANGFLADLRDIEWIHWNNQTFIASQREVCLASYTFVILRCPFTRVASSFLDLIVEASFDFKDSAGNKLSINFNDFLSIIKSQQRTQRDQHWRNQSDFLHYEKYDDYFSLESFSKAIDKLNSKEFKVFDTRSALKHNLSGFERVDGDFSKTKEVDLKKMKQDGFAPNYESMFSNQEIELVKEIYKDDIELYKSHFGNKDLLF